MDAITVIVVGLVATGYLSLVGFMAQRILRVRRASLTDAINSLVIPEQIKSKALAIGLHLINGILFAAAYAYVFGFVRPDSLRGYLELGGLIGLVHGFFTVYFMWMGFSSMTGRTQSLGLSAPTGFLLVVSHILYGLVLGFGFHSTATRGSEIWFLAYAGTVLVALIGLTWTLFPAQEPAPRRTPTERRHALAGGR